MDFASVQLHLARKSVEPSADFVDLAPGGRLQLSAVELEFAEELPDVSLAAGRPISPFNKDGAYLPAFDSCSLEHDHF
jgi:hypothetical protein